MGRPRKVRPPKEAGVGSAAYLYDEHSDPLDVEIGGRVRALRESRGFTGGGLASVLGINPMTVQRLETGHYSLRPERMVKICRALGVEPNWFFEGLLGDDFKPTPTDARDLLQPPAIFLLRKFSYLSPAQQRMLMAFMNDLLLAREASEKDAETKRHIRWARELEK